MNIMEKFTLIDHTADIGIHAYGKDIDELFANVATGMFSIITDLKKVSVKQEIAVSVEGHDRDDLLVRWLSELVYLFDTKYILFKEFKVTVIDDNHLKATVKGEPLDKSRHMMGMEIKAVTYHELEIKKNKDGIWEAKVLFDI